jgi:hypothetical protein
MGSSLPSVPPRAERTRPVRRCAVLIPAARAGSAACSQSLTRSARNPAPGGADSSAARPWVSPYQPMADPHSSVGGGLSSPASPVASALVPRTRLFLISALRAAVQRRSPIPAPARWTTAATSVKARGSSPPSTESGSQTDTASSGAAASSACDPGSAPPPGAAGRRASRVTWCPSPRRLAASAVPIKPDEPVIATLVPITSLVRVGRARHPAGRAAALPVSARRATGRARTRTHPPRGGSSRWQGTGRRPLRRSAGGHRSGPGRRPSAPR